MNIFLKIIIITFLIILILIGLSFALCGGILTFVSISSIGKNTNDIREVGYGPIFEIGDLPYAIGFLIFGILLIYIGNKLRGLVNKTGNKK